jgi:hypothetical protein
MRRQMAVNWNLEWNGIVQACYIRYSTDDWVSDTMYKGFIFDIMNAIWSKIIELQIEENGNRH